MILMHSIFFLLFDSRSGIIPRCLETQDANEIEDSLRANNIDGESDYESVESSKSIGIGVSFGIGTILILMIIIGFLFVKMFVYFDFFFETIFL